MFKLVRSLPARYQNMLRSVREAFVKELIFHDYNAIWRTIIEVRADPVLTTFPGAFVDWNNTSRYKKRATIFRGASPERFTFWFEKLVASMPQRNLPENFIFLNSWNEWSEGAYLEPDERYGYQYLEAVKNVLDDSRRVHRD